MEGSKEIFQQFREEEIHTMVSMPYSDYKYLTDNEYFNEKIHLIKHYNPELREKAKKNPKWKALEENRRECKEEQKDIEFEIRRSITES